MAAGQTLDYQSRPGVRVKKKQRDRLIRLSETQPSWALGFADEVWWSRLAYPSLHIWTEPEQLLRLQELALAKDDPDPKALACYGLLLRANSITPEQMLLRFVSGRPVSAVTTQFLAWCCQRLAAQGKTALLLVWDNASWHKSQEVRHWIRAHNRQVKQEGTGVRILPCLLPSKSPWLNPIEPKWIHGKRAVVEPDRILSAQQLSQRVSDYFGCDHLPYLFIPEKVA